MQVQGHNRLNLIPAVGFKMKCELRLRLCDAFHCCEALEFFINLCSHHRKTTVFIKHGAF